ncbi:hypothetical protein LTR17_020967 [Elasticomyces elasticus]|nr:hypothetical protein LTR17_020967 [Elasticomyces elasticus]
MHAPGTDSALHVRTEAIKKLDRRPVARRANGLAGLEFLRNAVAWCGQPGPPVRKRAIVVHNGPEDEKQLILNLKIDCNNWDTILDTSDMAKYLELQSSYGGAQISAVDLSRICGGNLRFPHCAGNNAADGPFCALSLLERYIIQRGEPFVPDWSATLLVLVGWDVEWITLRNAHNEPLRDEAGHTRVELTEAGISILRVSDLANTGIDISQVTIYATQNAHHIVIEKFQHDYDDHVDSIMLQKQRVTQMEADSKSQELIELAVPVSEVEVHENRTRHLFQGGEQLQDDVPSFGLNKNSRLLSLDCLCTFIAERFDGLSNGAGS